MDFANMMKAMSGGAGGMPGGMGMPGAAAGAGGAAPQMSEAEMRSMQTMLDAVTNGDPAMKKKMEGYWKMLDEMAKENPDQYNKFIGEQMAEMKEHDAKEQVEEEQKWVISSIPYFAFSVKPAKILEHSKTTPTPSTDSANIRLFDFGQTEEIKESFAANRETTEPLDGPKLYLNIVHQERVLPPLNAQKNLADPRNDLTWQLIPMCFSVPIKRRNLANVECWHFDAHINTCVMEKMRESQDRFRAIWNYIIMKFQNHVKHQFLFHKQSIKLSKRKKYKDALGSGQTPRKFTIPKEFEKSFFVKSRAKLEERKKKADAESRPKDVNLGDIICGKGQAAAASAQTEELKELNLPGGKTTKQAAASAASQSAAASEAPKKPVIMEMKDRPGLEADYESDPAQVKLVFRVEKEKSAKNIDLDVAEKELKLESANYELRYKFTNGVEVDPDSVAAKFSKKAHTLTVTLQKVQAKPKKPKNPSIHSTVYFDITHGGKPAGRVTIELQSNTPRTSENFRQLCTGESTRTATGGKKIHFKGSSFHRIIAGFMAQGGDFTAGNGTGGESIYGNKFDDENFINRHTGRGCLSMANAGPGTNGSQFFLCFKRTPHLDGRHVVFGNVTGGLEVLDTLEAVQTNSQDKPLKPVLIADCGQLE